jgi:hypothetical protein
METVCFSETLASTDKSTQQQNPEEQCHQVHWSLCFSAKSAMKINRMLVTVIEKIKAFVYLSL